MQWQQQTQRQPTLAELSYAELDELAREDLGWFAEHAFDFENGKHHEEWYGLLDNRAKQVGDRIVMLAPDEPDVRNDWIMLEAPRDHAKSTCFTVNYPTHAIGKNPNIRIVIASNAQDTSEGFVRSITTIIEQSEDYKRIFGNLKPRKPEKWTDTAIQVQRSNIFLKDPTVSAVSIGGQVVAKRADVIICDDILTLQNTRTAAQREFVKTWFWTVLFPLLAPGGRLIIVGTAWNKQDLYEELLGDRQFQIRKRYDSIVDEKKHITLWPERWTWDELSRRRTSMGTLAFNRAYRNITSNPEDSPFDEAWLQAAIKRGINRKLIRALDYSSWDLGKLVIAVGIDPAISKKRGADFFAISVIGMTPDKRKIPLYMMRRKLSPAQQRLAIMEIAKAFNPDIFIVESNAYQASLQLDLADTTDLPIEAYNTGGEKYDEEIGLNSLAVEFENGVWTIPYDSTDIYTVTMMNHLLEGMRNFTPDGGEHTEDVLMATWLANTGLRHLTVGKKARKGGGFAGKR
jgi:hypothetical protein